ncbi:MAG: ribosomal-processing cysteine protease Prp [Defluviitaleaceae bacterium]|nr:ribosomal-processing cysteine protease Prp [Defluviitaleaceae bacterium]
MITAKFKYEGEDVVAYEISGHAMSNEPGKDLVCAGVSAVAFGLTNALIGLGLDEGKVKLSDGYLRVDTCGADEDMNALIYGLIVSLETIERTHDDYLSVVMEV